MVGQTMVLKIDQAIIDRILVRSEGLRGFNRGDELFWFCCLDRVTVSIHTHQENVSSLSALIELINQSGASLD